MRTLPKTSPAAESTDEPRQRDLRAILHDRERELQIVVQRRVQNVASGRAGAGLDETEHAEAEIQEHVEVALIRMQEETLQRVRDALNRLDAGEYGNCAECDAEISEKRLRALPFAFRCTACEEQFELRLAQERRYGSAQRIPSLFTDQIGP
jgi:DnaK suppressor protein